MQEVKYLQQQATAAVNDALDMAALELIRNEYLGKNGFIAKLFQELKHISGPEKNSLGFALKQLKDSVNKLIADKIILLEKQQLQAKLASEFIDVTLPGRHNNYGTHHPITQIQLLVNTYFANLGFRLIELPEVIKKSSDANQNGILDSFFNFKNQKALRSNLLPLLIQEAQNIACPVKVITSGKIYSDNLQFAYQLAGIIMQANLTIANLKSLIINFVNYFFTEEPKYRLRANALALLQPALVLEISCVSCEGFGCQLCHFSGWVDLMFGGLLRPASKNLIGTPASIGFTLNLEKLMLLNFAIDKSDLLIENDLWFLKQF